MSLQEIKNLKDQKGFTIVELLIVIVVIGILAAIVIVAFNGVQQRARNTQALTDAQSIVKKAEGVNADSGSYPTTPGGFSGDIGALPSGIAVAYTTSATSAVVTANASGTTNPTTNSAITSALYTNTSTQLKTYTVKSCSGGLVVFYPEGSTVKTAIAGTGC